MNLRQPESHHRADPHRGEAPAGPRPAATPGAGAARNRRSAAVALLLGAAAVVVVVAAWRTQASNAGPVNRRTAQRLRRKAS
jgi:ferric-dicitrate binding protein FerR (iron transport regulator)